MWNWIVSAVCTLYIKLMYLFFLYLFEQNTEYAYLKKKINWQNLR